ncbi:hypothetical protein [Paenibacillus guangzhouensis]|nr:hypothetical protein [Paenibacillus guangzhouensis]
MSEGEFEAIKRTAYKVESIHLSGEKDKTYSVQVGDVWVGSIKKDIIPK